MTRLSKIDLNTLAPHQEVVADVCIIGAGAAGCYLAHRLARAGRQVVLLEAGPAKAVPGHELDFNCDMDATPYSGATLGRFFGLGGTTSRWGGLLAPHTDQDIKVDDPSAWAWHHIVSTVYSRSAAVLADLGYGRSADFDTWPKALDPRLLASLNTTGLKVVAAIHLPFRRKNFVTLLEVAAGYGGKPQIYTSAVAKTWVSVPRGKGCHVRKVLAVSQNGNSLEIAAKNFVIAAGAIESARILLEIDIATDSQALRKGSTPGCYLTDHLSLPIATVPNQALKAVADVFGPRFTGAWMRSLRLVAQDPRTIPTRGFAHFNFNNKSDGFELVRKCLQALQRRSLPRIGAREATRGALDIIRLAEARFFRSCLHIPSNAFAQLQLDVEQIPVRENKVRLTDKFDRIGRRVPAINWRVTRADQAAIELTAIRFIDSWPGESAGLPRLDPCKLDASGFKPHDAYHPTGTTRMGDSTESVVDLDLKVWGTDNLYVTSTGVLPSAGTANPTFSLLCLTHRLAEQLS